MLRKRSSALTCDRTDPKGRKKNNVPHGVFWLPTAAVEIPGGPDHYFTV